MLQTLYTLVWTSHTFLTRSVDVSIFFKGVVLGLADHTFLLVWFKYPFGVLVVSGLYFAMLRLLSIVHPVKFPALIALIHVDLSG